MITIRELAQTYTNIYARMEVNKPFTKVNPGKLPDEILNTFARKVVFGHKMVFVTLY